MLRIPGVILLCLCVLAMPSYAAITCGSACAKAGNAHEHDCCPQPATSSHPSDDGDQSPQESKDAGRHHCAAPCCGYVAHVLTASLPRVDGRPLADLLPAGSVLHDAVDHDAIFHPPRL